MTIGVSLHCVLGTVLSFTCIWIQSRRVLCEVIYKVPLIYEETYMRLKDISSCGHSVMMCFSWEQDI